MSAPRVTSVTEGSPAAGAGVAVGDELVSLNGHQPRDVIEYQRLSDTEDPVVVVRRPDCAGAPGSPAGATAPVELRVRKGAGEPLGLQVSSAVFDRVKTCDNHCPFCFIYQLPKGMRRSLYLKDDDYRLSFLYGNFTTLTRFTELDAERVLDERLGPLFVSIHATDPHVRARLLRNPKGATSLRWLRILLRGGIEVHGQVVVCPGVNDGAVLEDTLAGVLDEYPELRSLGVVPLGVSRYTKEPDMRPHTRAEAVAVCETVARWQAVFADTLGRRLAHAADEYYLMAGMTFPESAAYEGYPQHENGIGMVRAFRSAFGGDSSAAIGVRAGFFAAVDGAPPAGYRARRVGPSAGRGTPGAGARATSPDGTRHPDRPVTVLTGTYGAEVLAPLVARLERPEVTVTAVENRFFGGNIGVAGLLTGTDVAHALAAVPPERRCLLPDACLSEGRFLDGLGLADLPRPVEVVPSDGASLRAALDGPLPAGGGAP